LIPLSIAQNRSYALAKESGKKTAMWVREEHRDLFQHKVADPEIKVNVRNNLINHIVAHLFLLF
jgi:hypothetical protein